MGTLHKPKAAAFQGPFEGQFNCMCTYLWEGYGLLRGTQVTWEAIRHLGWTVALALAPLGGGH